MTDPVLGTHSPPAASRTPSGGVLLFVLLGAAAVGSLLAYRGLPGVVDSTPPTSPPAPNRTEAVSATAVLLIHIPRSESRVVTLEGTTDGLEVVNWSPHTVARTTETTTLALSLDYDVSLGWAATIRSTLQGRFLQVLLPGVFEPRWFMPASEGVSSFAWHATEPGRLAWVAEEPGEEPMLWVSDAAELLYRQAVPDALAVVPHRSVLRAWGEWGFSLAGAEGGVWVLEPSGQVLAERRDVSLLGAGAGRILVSTDSEWLLTDRSLSEEVPVPPAEWIVWAGDGERLAADDPGGGWIRIRIVETRTGRRAAETTVESPFVLGEHLRWTEDDFLIGHRSGSLDLVVLDHAEGRVEILEREGRTGTLWGLWAERVAHRPDP